MTIPTSNSLTGNPIQLQSALMARQISGVEGATDLAVPQAHQDGGVLQPSTLSRKFDLALAGPSAVWFRLGAIVGLAAGIAATALLVLSLATALDRLIAAG